MLLNVNINTYLLNYLRVIRKKTAILPELTYIDSLFLYSFST